MATVEQTCKDLGARLQEVQLDKNTAETNYSIEKQWRMALQVCIEKQWRMALQVCIEKQWRITLQVCGSIYTMCDLYSIYGVLFTVRNGHLLELWLVFFACVSVG